MAKVVAYEGNELNHLSDTGNKSDFVGFPFAIIVHIWRRLFSPFIPKNHDTMR